MKNRMDKGFNITCLECGSNDVFIQEDIDYYWGIYPEIVEK